MRRPDVDRMMASMSALEYKEWEAYERATGSLNADYERELLAQLIEFLQLNNILTGAAITKKGKKNPAGKFRKVLRPDEVYSPPEDYDDGEDDDEDEDEYDEAGNRQPENKGSGDGSYDPAKDPFADMK